MTDHVSSAAESAGSEVGEAAVESSLTAQSQSRAVEIVDNVLRAGHRLRVVLASHFEEFDLNDVRHAVLQIIDNASVTGGCSQSQLAEALQQSESSISTLVERMRTSGLLYRLRSKSDRRRHVLMLTDRGRELLRRVNQCHSQRMTALLHGFDPMQIEILGTLLKQLVNHLAQIDTIQDALAIAGQATSAGQVPAAAVHSPSVEQTATISTSDHVGQERHKPAA